MRRAFCVVLLAAALHGAQLRIEKPPGLEFLHRNSPTSRKYLIETMGGGVALLDYNNDGLLDIFLVNGGRLASTMKMPESFDRGDPRYWNRLYRQNRNGTFTDVTEAAGLAKAGDENYGMGAAVADYDNDGFPDLYVTSYGRNKLYHNNRNGTFTDVTAHAGVVAGGWSASAGFVDYDNDGHLDLFVTRYMVWDTTHNKACGAGHDTYCPPGDFPPTTNVLYHNRGDGTFEDVSVPSGIGKKQGRSLGVAFADYDEDGLTDIFVANDGMEQFLFHNDGHGTFSERAFDAGTALTDDGKPFSGMGVDFRDYDNDGHADLIITDLARQNYALYHNDGQGSFSYRALESGLASLTGASSGWGMGLIDFDNDGWKDLFVAQSHVMDNVEKMDPSLRYLQPPLLAMNHAGRFERSDSGMRQPVAGRGAAFGDLNNDGWPDVVMTVLGGAPKVFCNSGGVNHWLTIQLQGTRSNRDGLGARVKAGNQSEYATHAGSYLSSSDGRIHFGLGKQTATDVEIIWPSGTKQMLTNVHADQILKVTEPDHR